MATRLARLEGEAVMRLHLAAELGRAVVRVIDAHITVSPTAERLALEQARRMLDELEEAYKRRNGS